MDGMVVRLADEWINREVQKQIGGQTDMQASIDRRGHTWIDR